jgi:transposase
MAKGYTEEYKAEAIKLMEEIGATEASKKLGISDWTVRRWKTESGQEKKKESAVQIKKLAAENRELQEKIREMERENARIRKENEFLEDAASFFAASRQKSKQS